MEQDQRDKAREPAEVWDKEAEERAVAAVLEPVPVDTVYAPHVGRKQLTKLVRRAISNVALNVGIPWHEIDPGAYRLCFHVILNLKIT